MKRSRCVTVLAAAIAGLTGPLWSGHASAAPPVKVIGLGPITNSNPEGQCAALSGTSIAASRIGLPTTGADITSVTWHPATDPNGEYCQVMVSIHPVDPTAPDINARVNLPTNWNG